MRSSSTPRRRDAATTRRATTDDATTTIATDRIDRASRGVARAASNARLPSIDSTPARRGDRPNATDDAIATTSMARSTDVEIEIDPAPRDRSVRSNLDASIERSSNRAIDPSGSPSAPTSRPAAQRDGRRHERLGRRQRRFTTPERGTAAATDDDDDDDDTETVDVGAGAAGRVAAEIGIRPAASAESARGGGRRRVARIRCVDDDGATRANDGDGDDEREFLIDRSRARDDARTRRAREGTHAIAISTAPHDGDGR